MFIECFQKLYYGPMIQKVLRKTVYKRKFFLITREMHEAQYYQKKKKKNGERHRYLQNTSNFSHHVIGKVSRRK